MANTHSTTLVAASSQAWQANDSASLDLSTTATWEFWIKPAAAIPSSTLWGLVCKDDVNLARSYAIDYYNNGATKFIRCGVTSNGSTTFEENSLTYDIGSSTWVHVAVTFKGSNAKGARIEFFINGVSQGNGSTAGTGVTSMFAGTAKFGIGCYTTGTPSLFANAEFDEVRVWNVVRTQAEISANYQKELTGSESGLVAYYKLDNNGNDSTSNANTLTAYNSPTFTTDVPFTGAVPQNSNLLMYN
jgi:Concanavalin A-like lectin/glucanases superfamily